MSSGTPGSTPPGPPFYQPGGYPFPPPYVRPDSPDATPAMVLGLLAIAFTPLACCCGFGTLISLPLGVGGVVFGFIARGHIEASQGSLGGSGKALAGIVTGGTAIFIAVAYWVAILALGLGSALPHVGPSPTPSR